MRKRERSQHHLPFIPLARTDCLRTRRTDSASRPPTAVSRTASAPSSCKPHRLASQRPAVPALAHVDRRVERRAQPGATHANMPSPEPSGDASSPRSSSPGPTARRTNSCRPAPAPAAASTVLLPRPLLSPAAARSQPADYIVFDSTPAARARARLRLCSTLLDDHLALRHQLDGASAKRLALRCVLCGAAG